MENGLFTCPVCGKRFVCDLPGEWVYYTYNSKNYKALCCSWTCYRKVKAKIAKEKQEAKERKKNEKN